MLTNRLRAAGGVRLASVVEPAMNKRSLVVWSFAPLLLAQDPGAVPAASLPVREVTTFKDGHAYVIREAPLPAGTTLVVDELPAPVLGTFWPFATDGARLLSAKAGTDTVTAQKTALDLRQIATANVGKDVVVTVVVEQQKERVEGRLVAVPARTGDGAVEGDLMLVATATGTRALPFPQVRDLEVRGDFAAALPVEEKRHRLTLTFAGGGAGSKIGVMYVQQGLRWIPAYRVDIDGAGKAKVQMEATLVNDLVDLDRATVHMVVGVPQFAFAGLRDPISLQQEVAQVAANVFDNSRVSNLMSNAITTQIANYGGRVAPEPAPAVEGAEANEDLFVFTVRDVTLKKGERLVLPIAAFELPYRDVYTLLVPFAPPMEVRQGLQGNQVVELARELAAPKAMHVLRLQNAGQAPLTTAPALVLANGRVLAQARMRYAPVGAATDLEINAAIDIAVKSQENETKREDNIKRIDGTYGRIDMAGAIELTNHKKTAVEIEVRRRVLGLVDGVGQEGSKVQLDLVGLWNDVDRPAWWGWWGWPHWWFRWNGFGEFRWTVRLDAGAATKVDASWHYFWR